jgi:predicted RNA-binding protein with EMAP domain
MGAYDFMVNAIQSGQIQELVDKLEEIEKNLEISKEWIKYLNQRINELEITVNRMENAHCQKHFQEVNQK